MSELIRSVKRPFITVGFTRADYIVDGTADNVQIQAAIDSLPETGGTVFIKAGTYNISSRILYSKAGVTIQGAGRSSTVVKASGSIYDSGQNQHFGIFTLKNHTTAVSDICFRDLTIDCNSQNKTQALTITGGDGTASGSTSKVRIERITFKNLGLDSNDTGRAFIEFISGNIPFGDYGHIDDIIIDDCEFDTSLFYQIYFLGNFITNVKILRSYFHDGQIHTIQIDQYGTSSTVETRPRSHENWEIAYCWFKNTKLRTSGTSTMDINDSIRTGIKVISIHNNYFGPQTLFPDEDKININLHGSWGLEVKDNFFDQVSEPLSVGQSLAGSYYKLDSDMFTLIQGNIFYKIVKAGVDGDSAIFVKWIDNQFIYCADFCIGGYSKHWPNIYEGNFFYNCAADPYGVEEYHKAAIEIVGDGYIVRDNTFIDDRLLADPSTAPTLSQAAGGALGARTYYVKYTWANATGETLASSQANISALANNLVTVTMPSSLTYPSGATMIKVYASTTSGSETLQTTMNIAHQTEEGTEDWDDYAWTEPTTGLVAGAALPGANTTEHLMLYGIYEVGGAGGLKLPNKYYNNHFYGIETEIHKHTDYKRIQYDNYTNPTITPDGESLLESVPYAQGNITGATTFDVFNGEVITATLVGNVTTTLSSGQYVGQRLRLRLTQDGTGSRTISKPSNARLPGGAFNPTATAGATDEWTLEWDGTNWVETNRSLNLS